MIFIFIFGALLIAAAIALTAGYFHNRSLKKRLEQGEPVETPAIVQPPQECCGQHEVCEKESLLAAVSREIEYYNDEELDRFRSREPATYTEQETEEFRDVLYTMREDEVAGWVRSLQLRGVALPDTLKDEVFLIIGERRTEHS